MAGELICPIHEENTGTIMYIHVPFGIVIYCGISRVAEIQRTVNEF